MSKVNPATTKAIVDMAEAGRSTIEIAAALNLHKSTVSMIRAALGVAAPMGASGHANLRWKKPVLNGADLTKKLRAQVKHHGPSAVKARIDEIAAELAAEMENSK